MEIENIPEATSYEFDVSSINRLKELQTKISTEGLISRNDVLAVEEFIGNKVITNIIHPNKLTIGPSVNQVEEVNEVINNEITKFNLATTVSYHTLVDQVLRAESGLKHFKNFLTNFLSIPTGEGSVISKLYDKEVCMWYNGEDELVNLTEMNIQYVLTYKMDYLKKVLDDRCLKFIEDITWTEEISLPLLSVLKNRTFNTFASKPEITMVSITIDDLVNIIREPGLYIADVDKLLEKVKYDAKSIRDNSKWFVADELELTKMHRRYQMLLDIVVDDKPSNIILATLKRLN